jgi:hypothetical protein
MAKMRTTITPISIRIMIDLSVKPFVIVLDSGSFDLQPKKIIAFIP